MCKLFQHAYLNSIDGDKMLSIYHNLCEKKAHAFLSNSVKLNFSMSRYVNDDWS